MNTARRNNHQTLPPSGPAREALRMKGQIWTPRWLAKTMVSWVIAERPSTLFDPAIGPGTFFAAAREAGFSGDFAGFEVDGVVLAESCKLGLNPSELRDTIVGDFIGRRILRSYPAIISNPPYIRHHRLSEEQKKELHHLSKHCLGFSLDGRVGLHIYFLLKCLDHLAPNGRLGRPRGSEGPGSGGAIPPWPTEVHGRTRRLRPVALAEKPYTAVGRL